MIEKTSSFLYRHLNWKILVLSVVVMILFMVFVLPREAERAAEVIGSGQSPDTSIFYTPTDLYRMAQAYGPEGRAYYIRSRFTFDVAWPMVYTFFLVSTLTAVLRRLKAKHRWKLVNVLPFGAMLLDFGENSLASVVFYRYPLATPVIAHMTPAFTLSKWAAIGICFILLAGTLIAFFIRKIFPKKKEGSP